MLSKIETPGMHHRKIGKSPKTSNATNSRHGENGM
jgi:hypothetical protein